VRTALRVAGLIIGLCLAALALARVGRDAFDEMMLISPGWLVAALAILTAGTLLGTIAWWLLLRALGGPVPLLTGVAIAHLSQLGKYVPGMIVVPIAQAELGRSHGLRAREIVTAFSLSLVLSVMSALIVGIGGLALGASEVAREYLWLLLLLAPLPVLMSGRALSLLLGVALKVLRRPAEFSIAGRQLRIALGIQILATIVGGLHVWFLAIALGAEPLEALLPAVGGMSLAWVVGFLVAFVPAGIGVREGVLILVLEPLVGGAQAVAIAIVSRLLFTVMDLLLAGVALYLWRRSPDHDAELLPKTESHPSAG
jgi:uncharacterized membrane protein YbhN (UPF0104 family)